ncbi:L,D-transpeptidase family protein [Labilibaculum euxinus]|uniref:L,D-transpeptidase family protein n=1 Tax=Labilibaculum euxinus TaxID=2686357 RepID=A0A7M4D526_9BACT|nr:L,D-transpeptidase family protein [Labilibaculum euxinus]MUP37755.1 L,D-transpeptidase family protein [Labilibaculum euxinus]MVB06960.1 L,D-transpeptidase family protein [Labilibaculum euxinus]
MGKGKNKSFIRVVIAVVGLLFVLGIVLIWLKPKSPQSELKLAREALNSAQKAGAEEYAKPLYEEAKQLYDSAMSSWTAQNEQFFPKRDYKAVLSFVNLTIAKAIEAEQNSLQQIKNTNVIAKRGIEDLEGKILLYNHIYKQIPLSNTVSKVHNLGVMKLSEAKIAYDSERYNEAFVSYKEAAVLLNSSNDKAEQILKEWFSDYPHWEKMGADAIRLSKSGHKIILVDKMAHQLFVYQNGKILRSFKAELGVNWMGDKRQKGDKATPEGMYRVIQKKEGSRTKFYRALLINYPNEEDKQRFNSEKKKGALPFRTHIGNLIEIHGLGGKGIDWTDGCIALKNKDMDVLFCLIDTGISVIIVGSLEPLNEICEKN